MWIKCINLLHLLQSLKKKLDSYFFDVDTLDTLAPLAPVFDKINYTAIFLMWIKWINLLHLLQSLKKKIRQLVF